MGFLNPNPFPLIGLSKWRWNEIYGRPVPLLFSQKKWDICYIFFYLLLIQIHFHWLAFQNQNLLKPINENGLGRFHVQNKFKFSFGKLIMTVFLLANFYLNINMRLVPFALNVIKLSPQFTYRETALRLFRIHLDTVYFAKNWKYCSKIIFKKFWLKSFFIHLGTTTNNIA